MDKRFLRYRERKTTTAETKPSVINVGSSNSSPMPLCGREGVGLGEDGVLVGAGVGEFPGVEVGRGVLVLVGPGGDVEVKVGVSVAVGVSVGPTEVSVGVGVNVLVGVGVKVLVGVGVNVFVGVGVKVFVGVGVAVGACCAMLTLRFSQRRLAPSGGGDSIWKQA